jgi:thiol:disulfide interchange protein DsbG
MAQTTALAAMVTPPGLVKLERLMGKEHAGRIKKVFSAPHGYTGVVMGLRGKKGLGFITPDGKYFVSGLVENLRTGENLTLTYGNKYIGSTSGVVVGIKANEIAQMAGKLPAGTIGNKYSENQMYLVFNPATTAGKHALFSMMLAAKHFIAKGTMKYMSISLIPYGKYAPWVLSASNVGRIDRLGDILQHRFPGATTTLGATDAGIVERMLPTVKVVKPPFLIINMPQAGMVGVFAVKTHSFRAVTRAGAEVTPKTH